MSLSPMNVQIKEFTEAALKKLQLKVAKMATNIRAKGEGEFEVVATTSSVDRDGEILLVEGWDFKNYMNNPIVLLGHDWQSLPIGAVTHIEQKDGKIIMSGVFAGTPIGQEVRKLYDDGILRTVSVGCLIKERNGPVVTKMEMIELSFVAIPSNTDATRADHSKSFKNLEKMVKEAKKEGNEEEDKEVIKDPEPADEVTVPVELPKSTDGLEPQAKGAQVSGDIVLSVKDISAMRETLSQAAILKSGLDKVAETLQAILDRSDSKKAVEQEKIDKALREEVTAKLQLIARLSSEVNRDRKKL